MAAIPRSTTASKAAWWGCRTRLLRQLISHLATVSASLSLLYAHPVHASSLVDMVLTGLGHFCLLEESKGRTACADNSMHNNTCLLGPLDRHITHVVAC